jgi:hypothetical protein
MSLSGVERRAIEVAFNCALGANALADEMIVVKIASFIVCCLFVLFVFVDIL